MILLFLCSNCWNSVIVFTVFVFIFFRIVVLLSHYFTVLHISSSSLTLIWLCYRETRGILVITIFWHFHLTKSHHQIKLISCHVLCFIKIEIKTSFATHPVICSLFGSNWTFFWNMEYFLFKRTIAFFKRHAWNHLTVEELSKQVFP